MIKCTLFFLVEILQFKFSKCQQLSAAREVLTLLRWKERMHVEEFLFSQ